ncbi:MAG: hypothetical protein JXR07_19585 [Reichenbachiella sp.]
MEKLKSENPAQYLLDYLESLEMVISKHAQITYTKKYLIYRDGYLYTGTDDFNDVMKLVNNDLGLYTYRINHATQPPSQDN